MDREASLRRLIGTWRLISAESRSPDGEVTWPYGTEPLGYITYTAERRMAVVIMRGSPPRVETADIFAGAAEALSRGHTFIAYTGTVDLEDVRPVETAAPVDATAGGPPLSGTVVHHLDTCSYPNWIGTDQRRAFILDGDSLTLTTPPIARGAAPATAVVVWERVTAR